MKPQTIINLLLAIGGIFSAFNTMGLVDRVKALERILAAHPEIAGPATPARANDKGGK